MIFNEIQSTGCCSPATQLKFVFFSFLVHVWTLTSGGACLMFCMSVTMLGDATQVTSLTIFFLVIPSWPPKVSPTYFGSRCYLAIRSLHRAASTIWETPLVSADRSFARDSLSSTVPMSSWILAPHKQNSCLILQFFTFPCTS